jgi:Zn-dependent protease
MQELSLAQRVAVLILPVLFAIIVHEVAHGWVANRLGDPTARMLGRLTLNPIKHIDPVGTILVPGMLLLLGGFIFGWAKPVPVTVRNLRSPKRDMMFVALAGPGANLFMALGWGALIHLAIAVASSWPSVALYLALTGAAGVLVNLVLMVLNLLPLPPLDGGRVLMGLLPGPWSWRLGQIEPYGFLILVVLMATGWLWKIMLPPLLLMLGLVGTVTGLPDGTLSQLVNAL